MHFKYINLFILISHFLVINFISRAEEKFKKPNVGYTDIEKLKSGTEPFFEVWDEDNAYGVLDVAMDGTVLMFSLQGEPHPD